MYKKHGKYDSVGRSSSQKNRHKSRHNLNVQHDSQQQELLDFGHNEGRHSHHHKHQNEEETHHHHRHHYHRHRNHDKYDNYEKNREKKSYHERRSVSPKLFHYTRKESEKERSSKDRKGVSEGFKRRHHSAHSTTNIPKKTVTKDLYLERAKTFIGNSLHTSPHRQSEKKEKHRSRSERKSTERDRVSQIWYCQVDANSPFKSNKKIPEKFKTEKHPKIRHERGTSTSKYKEMSEKAFLKYVFNLKKSKSHHSRDPNVNLLTKPDRKDHVLEHTTKIDQKSQTREKYIQADTKTQKISDDVDKKIQDGMNVYFTKLQQLIDEKFNAFLKFNNKKYRTVESNKLSSKDKIPSIEDKTSADIKKISTGNKQESIETKTRSVERKMENPDSKINYETRKEKKKSHKSSQNEEQNKHLNIEQVKYQNDKYQNVPRNRIINSKEGYRRINNQNDIQNYLVTVPHQSENSGHQTYRVSSPKPTEYRQNSVISIDIKTKSKNKENNKNRIQKTISKPDDYSAHKTLKPQKDKKHDKYCGLKNEQQCLPSSNCQNIIREVMLGNIVGAPSTSIVHVKPNNPIPSQYIKPHSETPPKKNSNKYKDKDTNFWVEGIEPANMDTTSKHKKRNLVQNLECKTVSVIGIPSQIKHKPRQEEKAIVPIDEILEKKNRMKRFQLYYQYSLGKKQRPKSANTTTRSAISESMKVLSEQSLLTNGESHSTTTKKNVKIDNRKYITNHKTCDGTTLINIRLDDFHNYYLQGNKRDTSVTVVENIKDKITGKVNSTKMLKNDQSNEEESNTYKQLNEDIVASNSNIELSHNDEQTKHNSEDITVKEFYKSIDFFQRAFDAKIPENNVTNNQILQFLENMHQLYLTNRQISQSEIKEEKINSKNDKENNSFDESFTFNNIEQQTSVETVKKKSEMTGTSKKRKKHKSVYTNLFEDNNNNKICNVKVDKMTSYQDLNQVETTPDNKNVTTTNNIKDCIIQTDFSQKCVNENKKPKQNNLQNKNKNNEQKNEATQSDGFLDYLKKCSLSQSTQTRIQTRDNVTETILFNKLDQSKKNNRVKTKKEKLKPILEKKVKIEEDKNEIRKKRSHSPSKSSVVSCPVGKSRFESSDNFKFTKSQSEINFEKNGSIDDGSQTNAQSLDQFLSSNKSNSSRLMLTKQYRTGDVSAYQKRKKYDNLIRKKMKKKSPREKSMEQIFEVRYLTLEDNLLKSSYDNIAEFILQSLQHNSESKFKENDLNTIKLYDFLNQVSNFPLEDDSDDNLLNCNCCAAGKNFMNFVNYLCNMLKSNCNPVQQIDKDPTFNNAKIEIGDLHIQTNALKNDKVNISEDTKNLNSVRSEKNLRKKKVNLLHRSATDNSMFNTGKIYEDFHSADTSSCPALRTIDTSFDFLYQDDCIRGNKRRLLVPILGFVSKKLKTLRRQDSPGSETSGYASSRSKQSCSFLNFFKRPKIAALLKPQTEEGIYGNAVGSLDNNPDILKLELCNKSFQEVSINFLHRASSFTFGNSSLNSPFDNFSTDSCNVLIPRKTASDTNLLFKELFVENVELGKTLDVQFINTSLGISNPSISSDDLFLNEDSIHYVSIFEKILTSEVYMDITNLSSCSITLVESEFSTNQSLLSLQNTNYNEYSTTEITTLITRKFFENIVEMYDKETALSCALYENKDFINNQLLPSIRSEDDKKVNKKKRPLSSRIKSVIKKIITGNRTIKGNEEVFNEMIRKFEPVENEYQYKLQALAHNAHKYYSSLIDLNIQNNDEMKYYGILRLIEAIEKGRFKFLKKFKSLTAGTNLELEIQDQVKKMFIDVHSFANLEAEKCHRKLTENDLRLIGAFVCKYRIGLLQGIELIATYLGKGFFKTESQLKAAVTYLLKTSNKVDLQDFEQFCESIE